MSSGSIPVGPTAPAVHTAPAPQTVTIDGKEYAVEDLREFLRAGLREADYTRKTQAVAEERRRMEEWEAELRSREEQLAAYEQQPASSETYDDTAPPYVKALISRIDKLTQASELDRRRAEEAAAQEQEVEHLEAELSLLRGKPYFDEREILQFMKDTGLKPGQVKVAYDALYGPKIGQVLGEKMAGARGATEPAILGSSPLSMTTPFASPGEVAKAVDWKNASWQDVKRMALEDSTRPRG